MLTTTTTYLLAQMARCVALSSDGRKILDARSGKGRNHPAGGFAPAMSSAMDRARTSANYGDFIDAGRR